MSHVYRTVIKKYKSGELCKVLGLKETRMKEILRLLVNLGKIHTDGTFRDRTYSLNDEN
jgi:hypothetical protein